MFWDAINNAINGTIGLGMGIYDRFKSSKEYDTNMAFAKEQFGYQQGIDKQNFDFAQEKLNYDKQLQQTMFNREDNSIQRRVADMKAAGINPVLAAGSGAGAGAVVSTTAPYRENNTDPSAQINLRSERSAQRMAQSQMIMNALKMQADIAYTKADTERVKVQTERERGGIEHDKKFLDLAIDRLSLDGKRYDTERGHLLLTEQLDQARLVLEKDKWRVQKVLERSRTRLVDAQTAVEELKELGLSQDIAAGAIKNKMLAHDLEITVTSGVKSNESRHVGMILGDRYAAAIQRNKEHAEGKRYEYQARRGKGAGQYLR
jgi:hypothetical protein